MRYSRELGIYMGGYDIGHSRYTCTISIHVEQLIAIGIVYHEAMGMGGYDRVYIDSLGYRYLLDTIATRGADNQQQ
jgi:hypothetical protein